MLASLVDEGQDYSFLQVLRLIRAAGAVSTVTPRLSLAFPAADVAGVERTDEGDFRVFANFLGLYGTSSPLPAFYTEELNDEASHDRSVRRDFLDIVHRRLYELYFECWRKYRIWNGVVEGDEALLERLFALVGLAEPELRESLEGIDPVALIRYASLFGGQGRSAAGLQTLLRDALGGLSVSVEQCVAQAVKINADERLGIGVSGCILGENAVLGEEVADLMGKFRLRIGPLGKEDYESLLPGGALHKKVVTLVDLYVSEPLEYDLELILREDEVETICLGGTGSARLGLNSWCFAGSYSGNFVIHFECRPMVEIDTTTAPRYYLK